MKILFNAYIFKFYVEKRRANIYLLTAQHHNGERNSSTIIWEIPQPYFVIAIRDLPGS